MKTLKNSKIDSGYIHFIGNVCKEATSKLKLHKTSDAFSIRKGVRQSDIISLKLFNAALKKMFKKLNWDEKVSKNLCRIHKSFEIFRKNPHGVYSTHRLRSLVRQSALKTYNNI